MTKRIWADDMPYWRTGTKTTAESWLSKAAVEVERVIAGEVSMSGFGRHEGKACYFLQFQIDGSRYRVVWPILEVSFSSRLSKEGKLSAARRQAATAMYHDIKAACVRVRFLGPKAALFAHLELPDGRVAAQLADAELLDLPLALPAGQAAVVDAEVLD